VLTKEARPKTFDELAGQELNKRILKSIIKNPEDAPRSIIMQGYFGSGKTTASRIFSKALNCERKTNPPCLKCPTCLLDLDSSPFYAEYDSAVVGNVDKIRELRDTFYYRVSSGWKVIVFDEVHTASKQSQSALLKVLEEGPSKVFFVFATTDIEKVLPTIRSRSLELRFELIPEKDIINNLRMLSKKYGFYIDNDIHKIIAVRSRGHMRNAHMLLDKYLMLGGEDFLLSVRSARDDFLKFFYAVAVNDKDSVFSSLDNLMTYPLADLKIDFENVILELSQHLVGYSDGGDSVQKIIDQLGSGTLKLIKLSMADWVSGSFTSDLAFQACFLSIYQMFSRGSEGKQVGFQNIQRRHTKS